MFVGLITLLCLLGVVGFVVIAFGGAEVVAPLTSLDVRGPVVTLDSTPVVSSDVITDTSSLVYIVAGGGAGCAIAGSCIASVCGDQVVGLSLVVVGVSIIAFSYIFMGLPVSVLVDEVVAESVSVVSPVLCPVLEQVATVSDGGAIVGLAAGAFCLLHDLFFRTTTCTFNVSVPRHVNMYLDPFGLNAEFEKARLMSLLSLVPSVIDVERR